MITTLVLGAGISQDFGYPSGPSLVKIIKKKLEEYDLPKLLEMLKIDNCDSIDSFIARYPEHTEKIKLLIAEIIYQCENKENLIEVNSFYKFFFNKIGPEHFDKFRIITFNYDRSFEQYAYQNTVLKLKGDHKATLKAIAQLQITHIHGRLSCLEHEIEKNMTGYEISHQYELHEPYFKKCYHLEELPYGKYAEIISSEDIYAKETALKKARQGFATYILKSFKFISENGDFNKQAVSILKASDRIVFLGFSYNEDNLRVLGFNEKRPFHPKEVYGTGLGLTPMRKAKAERFGINISPYSAIDLFEQSLHLDQGLW